MHLLGLLLTITTVYVYIMYAITMVYVCNKYTKEKKRKEIIYMSFKRQKTAFLMECFLF